MDEAEQLFNQRLEQQMAILHYSFAGYEIPTAQIIQRLAGSGKSVAVGSEFQWLDKGGKVLARTHMMPQSAVVTVLREGFTYGNFAGYRWHVLTARSGDGASWFVLAERDDQRFRMAEAMILPAVYPMVVAVPFLGVLIWVLLGFGLKPIVRLAAELERREASDLQPVPVHEMPRELLPLAHATNSLFRRLTAAFAREKRFSADAAHELRTPIAALSIQVENLVHALPERQAEIAKLQKGIVRMQRMVEQILLLNQIAPDQFVAQFRPLDLSACVRAEIANQSEALSAKALEIELDDQNACIRGDHDAISALLRNLLDNAIKYTPYGGQIRVRTFTEANATHMEIADNGVGIPEPLRVRVLDRFYRVGGDQHRADIPGCGLGLSIVQQVAELHGAKLAFLDSPLGCGVAVRVSFSGMP